jgi:protein involved in polysaccharide export with SLBB domain
MRAYAAWIGILAASSVSAAGFEDFGLGGSGHGAAARDLREFRMALPGDAGVEDLASAAEPSLPLEGPLDDKDYYVGPGDELQVYVGRNYNIRINPESYLNFPGFAPIPLAGLSLAAAKVAIKDALGKSFKKELIYVSIRALKIIKVPVLGEVANPGLYSAAGNMRISELITKAQGFNRLARAPFVHLIEEDGTRKELDLGAYFRNGDGTQNPYVRVGEKVMVPRIDLGGPRIELIMGSSSLLYQLHGKESLADIMGSMFPFLPAVDIRTARLKSGKVLAGADLMSYFPADGDQIELIGKNLKVFLEGELGKPIAYAYTPGYSVRDYMAEAGMSLSTQSSGKIRVVRTDGKTEMLEISSLDVEPGDHIYANWSGYARFKDYLLIVSSISAVVLTTLTLINASRGF